MGIDLLARAKKVAKPQTTAKAPKDTMKAFAVPLDLRERFVTLCEMGFIASNLDDVLKTRHIEMGDELLKIWAREMWASRSKPDNYRVGNPRSATVMDCGCNFLVKFRTAALKEGRQIPVLTEIPEGQTFEEIVVLTLTSEAVGLSAANAKRFVQEEIVITDDVGMKSLTEMYNADEGSLEKSVATKLLTYLSTRSKAAVAKLPPVTEEEEQAAMQITQTVTLKDDLLARIFTYCESYEQLVKLLQWIAVTKEISRFVVGESDEQEVRRERLGQTIIRFLPVDVKKR